MSYDDNQNEFPLPAGNEDKSNKRRSAYHLPKYFRTTKNNKFLAATLDQMIQPGVVEKLNGYVGRESAKAFSSDDTYLTDVTKQRTDYQLEPAAVIKDSLDNVTFYKDYNDFMNQLQNFNLSTNDHSKTNSQESYAWDPQINWDKFSNFREYYWLPSGPQTIGITGKTSIDIKSTYSLDLVNNGNNYGYVFTPNGLTQNPTLVLYRGVEYKIDVNTPGLPVSIKTKNDTDSNFLYTNGVTNNSIETGTITIKLESDSPDILYYLCDDEINAGGVIRVYDQTDAKSIDVEAEVLGKKNYTTGENVTLSNGMKITFQGEVTPSKYATGSWYVEGVGDKIKLIAEEDLSIGTAFAENLNVKFDSIGFDNLPFSEAIGYPQDKDYIVINRASPDGNLWSRYNRWFHKSVIEQSANINNQPVLVDQSQRARRPIIEFDAGLKLHKFGTKSKVDVNLIDNYTTDAFSTIEGKTGYNIDGIDLTNGMRVMFIKDPDPLVNGRIFEVKFFNFADGQTTNRQLSLVEVTDAQPAENEVVLVKQGTQFGGKLWYFDGTEWKQCQEKTKVNQPPYFDIFDNAGKSYSDTTTYPANTFPGTKFYSYAEGTGTNDTELGFPLKYRSISNVGDITFNFNLNTDSITYQLNNEQYQKYTKVGYARKYSDLTTFTSTNGWCKKVQFSDQPIIRQYINDLTSTGFEIDVYDSSSEVTDLWLRVFVNNTLQFETTDYNVIDNAKGNKEVVFVNTLNENDIVILKTKSSTEKNNNGYYEIASNLEKNPNNSDLNDFTLGEVNDHVATIVEETTDFSGTYPGSSNLRDLDKLSGYGNRFLKHSGPFNLALYHLLDKDANIIKSLKYSRKEYAKFKRLFIQTADKIGFEGPVKEHVDKILFSINKDKTNTQSFYFSDMVPYTASKKTLHTVINPNDQFYALSAIFDIATPSDKAVAVYLNQVQLTYGKDYTFNNQGFVRITKQVVLDDIVEIYEYETTNGSYVPATPSKLGLYPKYEPEIYLDTTYVNPVNVIQGHDGSRTIAYNDFRDNLLLELEKRIYNNIKTQYDQTIFDVLDFAPSEKRKTNFSLSEVNAPMLSDFIEWTNLVQDDYTENTTFDRSESFTFNYAGMNDRSLNILPGFWRAVYKHAYDTDRPHTHPWEMLGFSVKPTWWETKYGPSPYTKDNLIMWQDIEEGKISEPNKAFIINKKYIRPNLTKHLPVDDQGNLLSPNNSGYVQGFDSTNLDKIWLFGDHGPVETAWRNSSEYAFSLITSYVINQPHHVFSRAFDRTRQIKNLTDQIIYKETSTHIHLNNLIFPPTTIFPQKIFTSGLCGYIADYMSSDVTTTYDTYKDNIKNLQNQLGLKLGGFTDKSKFKLILDSRTPTNEGNVFIPDENFTVFENTSSPIQTVSYSGVIVEKLSSGYVIRGYSNSNPYFDYFKPIRLADDPVINIGGVSESYLTWDQNKVYRQGQYVEFNTIYYVVKENHTSSSTFDDSKFTRLAELPLVGGRDGIFSTREFEKNATRIPYGTQFTSVQAVIDFLLGLEHYYKSLGFTYEKTNSVGLVEDWSTSAKELMFWTTQNWSPGSVISLSPAAEELTYNSSYSVVSNVFDSFYGYSLFKADGKKLNSEFVTINRSDDNQFKVSTKNTADGIYSITLPLVQKEHVVLIDNVTVFNDIIYDIAPGYRQERIKILGYRTDEWNGSFNIPGFIYDKAEITEWQPWTDYKLGDLIKYKEFYYSANAKIAGAANFQTANWRKLDGKPEAGLIANFDYKTNQFADFYDLDSDNFEADQQKLAQHLIGYQKRDYLSNIINDDVSQYKFYQGFIQDKGTKNALTKLFDVLGSADKDSLEFYEEWAIKSGQYGASAGFNEVEFVLDETKFKLKPQPIELTNSVTGQEKDLIYRILPYQVYLKPKDYNSNPFPAKYVTKPYVKDAGYVNQEDVQYIVANSDAILSKDINTINNGDYFWVGNDNLSWNVFKHVAYKQNGIAIKPVGGSSNNFYIEFNSTVSDFVKNDVIGIKDVTGLEGYYKVASVSNNLIECVTTSAPAEMLNQHVIITRFISVRTPTLNTLNDISQTNLDNNDIYWVDSDDQGKWKVLKNNQSYKLNDTISNELGDGFGSYGSSIAADDRNGIVVVGAPEDGDGKVYVYQRPSSVTGLDLIQTIEADTTVCDPGQKFGSSVAISPDGEYILVGSPNASNVKTKYKGAYQLTTDYPQGEIVQYEELLWRTVTNVEGQEANIQFGSFQAVSNIIESLGILAQGDPKIKTILTGNYPFKNLTGVDHLLIRAPKDMYEGSGIGDSIKLEWNTVTTANQDQTTYTVRQPFNGTITGINEAFINSGFTISKKIDAILSVPSFTTLPQIGEIIQTQNAFGTVAYTFAVQGAATIYLENVNGTFATSGSVQISSGEFVGEYNRAGPDETVDATNFLDGYWFVNTTNYNVGTTNYDEGRGLVYKDVVPSGVSDPNRYYYNINDTATTTVNSLNNQNSLLRVLSTRGYPGPNNSLNPQLSDLYVVRAPKALTDTLTASDTFDLYVNKLPKYSDNSYPDITKINLTYAITNKRQTVYDLWDGYINFEFTKFGLSGDPFEPRVGATVQDVTTGATGIVTRYQRSLNDVTIFIKGKTGNWSLGDLYGNNSEIRFLGVPGDADPVYQVDRVMGQIQSTSLGNDSLGIGKLIVIQHNSNFTVPNDGNNVAFGTTDSITDAEYYFYKEGTVNGIPRAANIPTVGNNDWELVNRIFTDSTGTTDGNTQEGFATIFQRTGSSNYSSVGGFTVPDKASNNKFGSAIKITKFGSLYNTFIHADANPGKIYFINKGTSVDGQIYDWSIAKDPRYRGEFTSAHTYLENDIIFYSGNLYKAITNISAGTFNTEVWTLLTNYTDYVGYIPNNTSLVLTSDDSVTIDQTKLTAFGDSFDVSTNGDVLVTSATSTDSARPSAKKIAVYRSFNGQFLLDQEIFAQQNNGEFNDTLNFGKKVSISNDGMLIAVSAPNDDTIANDQGLVFVYKQVNGQFVLSQTLKSKQNKIAEFFGSNLEFDGETLYVSARGGNGLLEDYTFDGDLTTFDNNFTRFTDVDNVSGVVYVYEKIDNTLVFAQVLSGNNELISDFGENIHASSNHVYVGLPNLNASDSSLRGYVQDFRRPEANNVWQSLRTPIDTVDVSKIKRAILYNKRTQVILKYLDYIDPLQGKIAGIADQEIRYKTYYDPAFYTNGGSGVNINPQMAWGEAQVGQVWWDLTNAKFLNPYQGNIINRTSSWNTLFDSNTIDVYEWVETTLTPAEWSTIADTEQGITKGISGKPRYNNTTYVTKQVFDKVGQKFTNKYFYWVKDKKTIPDIESRSFSVADVSKYISDPNNQSYPYVELQTPNSFVLHNCDSLIEDSDVVLGIQYWTIKDQQKNIHNQYQIITDGLGTSKPSKDVENKWFDSLVGYDVAFRPVPDPSLSIKEKYGALNTPRQSWFVNRTEALKQVIERVNSVMNDNLIVDNSDISLLSTKDPEPTAFSREYDTKIDTFADLAFVGVAKARRCVLQPVIEDGKITRVVIVDSGQGYSVVPTYTITSTGGTGVNIQLTIDSLGKVTTATVLEQGNGYTADTTITVRRFVALVAADETINGKWATYERLSESLTWSRKTSQSYNTALFWDYADWYATGYSQQTKIDYLIDQSYELQGLNDSIGEIVKISTIGSGGWLLLEKTSNTDTTDYTVNYKTIGKQNGTIKFKSSLYNLTASQVGFDAQSFDTQFFDSQPINEIRTILNVIKNNILVDDLENEYNKLFFASLKYVLSEQLYVDWAFKTSFVKAKHNTGQLSQKITFQNDSLPSYEKYLNEVKPFKTKLREYLSTYEKTDNSRSVVTDFDLPAKFDSQENNITPSSAKVVDGVIVGTGTGFDTYPEKHWIDNATYSIESLLIGNSGIGYLSSPQITISGGGGTGATAEASIGANGKITNVVITNPGSGYISTPTVTLNGTISDTGKHGKLTAKLGNGLTRSILTKVKFDRVSGLYLITKLNESQTFTGTGTISKFDLTWPMDLSNTSFSITIDNLLLLSSDFTYENVLDTTKGYDRYYGRITFNTPPKLNSTIVVSYQKSTDLLEAQDRINLIYNPTTGQYAKDIAQLMDGVDYGGVEVKSFEFGQEEGWDVDGWYSKPWDTFDDSFEDEIFLKKKVTLTFSSTVTVDAGEVIIQDGTGASGTVIAKTTGTSVVLDTDFSTVFNTTNEVRFDDSTLLSSFGKGIQNTTNAVAIPTAVSNYVNLTTALENNITYNVYTKTLIDGQRLNVRRDDPSYDGSTVETNPYAVMLPITGDGTTTTFSLDTAAFSLANNDTLIIRKITSDGSLLPDSLEYDTQLDGGNLLYSNATGIEASDINIDGDGFVTQTTAKGPEEIVPGQVQDTLDITVFERPTSGGSKIYSRNYTGDGTTLKFPLGTVPFSFSNVFVKVNYDVKEKDTDYRIDYDTNELVFFTAPALGAGINLSHLSLTGAQILDIDTFTGDGSTVEFLTNVRWIDNFNYTVTVDGTYTDVGFEKSDASYAASGNIVIKFASAPKTDAVINYGIFQGNTDTFSQVTIDNLVADGTSTAYELSKAPFAQQPAAYYTVVTVGDNILNAGYSETFVVSSVRQYQLRLYQIPVATTGAKDIELYLNGRRLTYIVEWEYEGAGTYNPNATAQNQPGSTITLRDGVGVAGDELRVHIISDGEYRFGYYDSSDDFISTAGEDSTTPIIYFDTAYAQNQKITVYQFSNHDVQKIERQNFDVVERTSFNVGSSEFYEFRLLRSGLIPLRKLAVDSEYVWIAKNGTWLTPNRDYYLTENKKYIKTIVELAKDDVIDLIHFSSDTVEEKFGWRQFKDILNRDHYKRLDNRKEFILTSNLNWYDQSIKLNSTKDLPDPDATKKLPGVVFIEGERIEYLVKTDTELKQLRRGTLGTGTKDIYTEGTTVLDQSIDTNMPYRDVTVSQSFVGDGTSNTFSITDFTFNPNASYKDQVEVFVGGKRLRKDSVQAYKFEQIISGVTTSSIAQDSPEGDETLPAQYTFTGNNLVLAMPASENTIVNVVKKEGRLWSDPGTRLAKANNNISSFLLASTIDLPR